MKDKLSDKYELGMKAGEGGHFSRPLPLQSVFLNLVNFQAVSFLQFLDQGRWDTPFFSTFACSPKLEPVLRVWPLSCPNCCLETSPDTFLPLLQHSATVCYFSYALLHPTQSTTQVLKFNKAGYMKSICQWWRITFQLMHWVPGCKFSANIIWLAFNVLPMWTKIWFCLKFFSRTSKKDSIWFMFRCFELSRCISCRYLDEERLCPASQDSRG